MRGRGQLTRLGAGCRRLYTGFRRHVRTRLHTSRSTKLGVHLLSSFLPILRQLLYIVVSGLGARSQGLFGDTFATTPLCQVTQRVKFRSMGSCLVTCEGIAEELPRDSSRLVGHLRASLRQDHSSFGRVRRALLETERGRRSTGQVYDSLHSGRVCCVRHYRQLGRGGQRGRGHMRELGGQLLG